MILLLNKKITLVATLLIASLFLAFNLANAQTNTQATESTDAPKPEQTETPKDPAKIKRDERDLKTITDRTQKTKDDYIIQIRLKFLNSADKLASISTKIETRVTKLKISGQDTSDMEAKLDLANANLKEARSLLKSLPAKQSLLNYSDAKKYAQTIIDARTNLENAKDTLTNIISDLKDFIIDKDDEKN